MSVLGRTTPCHDCPARLASAAGWLGSDDPVSFMTTSYLGESDLPCHTEIDYSDPKWLTTQEPHVSMCAGMLLIMANDGKMPRASRMVEAVKAVASNAKARAAVFRHPHEFLSHHMHRDVTRDEARDLMARNAMVRSVSPDCTPGEPCPDGCGATGANVYRASAHPTTCEWMMYEARRCSEHDEILRDDEPECPTPQVPEEADDPHNRLTTAP